MEKKCPKCGSSHLDQVDVMGSKCLICLSCGYDESELLEEYPSSRGGKGGKGSPYKRGGSMRSSNKTNKY